MTVPRLKAGIFVRALIRRAEVAGAHAYVLRKGSEEAGAVVLKLLRRDGTSLVLNQARNGDGALVWVKPLGDASEEEKSRIWFDRQTRFDPDLWIVEIEDADGRSFVDEPIV
ncbi:MAG: DUF1491 family protein [Proteobacteria bacterium]|nr:DUF1491 family protein [Pseudomonadota bacterium]